MILSRRLTRRRSRLRLLWYPVVSVVLIDLIYQVLISWRQSNIIAHAQPGYLWLAVANQLSIYVLLVPAMQRFYEAADIQLTGRRAFSLLTMGLAFARVIPLGDYLVWRTGLRREPGGVSATTQWYVMYYAWMFAGLVALFLIAEAVTDLIHPHAVAQTLAGDLSFLPVSVSVLCLVGLAAVRLRAVRNWLRQLIFDRLGSQSLLPPGIIRDRHLGPSVLGMLTFASFAVWTMEGFTLYLCIRSIGVNMPVSITIFGFAFARLFSLIPVLPGGIGQLETGTALFFAAYGYGFNSILTATVLYRLISYWPALVIGATSYLFSNNVTARWPSGRPVFATQLHRR